MIETSYCIHANISLKIALLTDFHNGNSRKVVKSLKKNRPDLIAIAGDFLLTQDPNEDILVVQEQIGVLLLISTCTKIAPTYISLGNHEWMVCDEDIEVIKSTGAIVLDNRWEEADGFFIGGLTAGNVMNYRQFRLKTGNSRYPDRSADTSPRILKTESAWLKDFERVSGYKILLSHHPEYWSLQDPMLIKHNIDLILSGHAHGGQIRILNKIVLCTMA